MKRTSNWPGAAETVMLPLSVRSSTASPHSSAPSARAAASLGRTERTWLSKSCSTRSAPCRGIAGRPASRRGSIHWRCGGGRPLPLSTAARRAVWLAGDDSFPPPESAPDALAPDEQAVRRDEDRRVSRALARVAETERAVLLAYYLEMSVSEISRTLAIPEGTVKTRPSGTSDAAQGTGHAVTCEAFLDRLCDDDARAAQRGQAPSRPTWPSTCSSVKCAGRTLTTRQRTKRYGDGPSRLAVSSLACGGPATDHSRGSSVVDATDRNRERGCHLGDSWRGGLTRPVRGSHHCRLRDGILHGWSRRPPVSQLGSNGWFSPAARSAGCRSRARFSAN